jgi:hypothetical protein
MYLLIALKNTDKKELSHSIYVKAARYFKERQHTLSIEMQKII